MTDDHLTTYRHGQIPDSMATMTMLARQRRRPAPGQKAVGYYPVRRGGRVPLYAIADSIELPPLSARQHERWIANRTCARCEQMHADPVPKRADGRRVDWACWTAERRAAAQVSWLRLRMEAVAWARALTAVDDWVVLVGEVVIGRGWDASPVQLRAEDRAGRVLVDVLTWPSPYENIGTEGGLRWLRLPRTVSHMHEGKLRRLASGGAVDCDEIVPYLYPLIGRPLVYLTLGASGHPIGHVAANSRLWSSWEQSLYAGPALDRDQLRSGDFATRWRDWLCEPQTGQSVWPGRDGLQPQPVEASSAAAGVELMRAGLARMAADDHPDGPALCPVLPPTGLEPCGEPAGITGTCLAHAPARDRESANAEA